MFRLYTAKKMKNCCCYSVAGDLTSVFNQRHKCYRYCDWNTL